MECAQARTNGGSMASDAEAERIKQKKMAEMKGKVEQNASRAQWPGEPVAVSDADFDAFVMKYPKVVIDCWAPWCGPCRMLSPTIDAMAKDMRGEVVFGKLNTDDNFFTSGKYRISGIPTLLIFKEGQLVDRMVGAAPRTMVEAQLKKTLG